MSCPEEEDNQFICWVNRKRHLSSMTALRAIANVAEVRLEQKLRYEYVKLKARGQLRNRSRCASATSVAAGSDPVIRSNPLPPTNIGEKRSRLMDDPCPDVQKIPRRMGNPAEWVSHTSMCSPTPATRATSTDNRIGHDDDVDSGVSPRGTGGSLAHRAASVVVGVPKEEHEKVLLEMSGLRETLSKTQSALDATQARVQALESGNTRTDAHLDLLIRIQQPMARPTYAAQSPSS